VTFVTHNRERHMLQSDLMTLNDIAKATGIKPYTLKKFLQDTEPAVSNKSGSVKMWNLENVRTVVRKQNEDVLKFLGYTVDPSESYDVPLNLQDENEAV
jgi:hypothetical protein